MIGLFFWSFFVTRLTRATYELSLPFSLRLQ
jgi:hypothetical protein